MRPTIINLLILAAMDVPDVAWKEKKPVIIHKVIEALPKENIKLLTFNPEDVTRGYHEPEKDSILLEIKIINMPLESTSESRKSLVHRIKYLMESKPVIVENYTQKLAPENETSQTRITLNINAA